MKIEDAMADNLRQHIDGLRTLSRVHDLAADGLALAEMIVEQAKKAEQWEKFFFKIPLHDDWDSIVAAAHELIKKSEGK